MAICPSNDNIIGDSDALGARPRKTFTRLPHYETSGFAADRGRCEYKHIKMTHLFEHKKKNPIMATIQTQVGKIQPVCRKEHRR